MRYRKSASYLHDPMLHPALIPGKPDLLICPLQFMRPLTRRLHTITMQYHGGKTATIKHQVNNE
jgi:hypothetical protein